MAENEKEMMVHVLKASLDVLNKRYKRDFNNLYLRAKRVTRLREKIAELEKRKIINI